MKIVLVYRPELDNAEEPTAFDGIEVLGVANDDDGAHELIQRIKDEHLQPNVRDLPSIDWQFHIDEV